MTYTTFAHVQIGCQNLLHGLLLYFCGDSIQVLPFKEFQMFILFRMKWFFFLQNCKQNLKFLLCLVIGHDLLSKIDKDDKERVTFVKCVNGDSLYHCHRCWKYVPIKKDSKN